MSATIRGTTAAPSHELTPFLSPTVPHQVVVVVVEHKRKPEWVEAEACQDFGCDVEEPKAGWKYAECEDISSCHQPTAEQCWLDNYHCVDGMHFCLGDKVMRCAAGACVGGAGWGGVRVYVRGWGEARVDAESRPAARECIWLAVESRHLPLPPAACRHRLPHLPVRQVRHFPLRLALSPSGRLAPRRPAQGPGFHSCPAETRAR